MLGVIVGAAVVGGSTLSAPSIGPAVADAGSAAPSVTLPVAYAPRPSPWAVPSPTVDPATFEGAGALAATEFVIPPPRWLATHRSVAVIGLKTARVGGLGWQTDPYAK